MKHLHGSRPLLSVIVPTIGRPSLLAAMRSVAQQPGSALLELLVIADTHGREIVAPDALPPWLSAGWYSEHDAGYSAWGAPQRNYAMKRARGLWLAFLDDDDAWHPDALAVLTQVLVNAPRRPHIFRMQYPDGRRLWEEPLLQLGNVGTPMFVVPNDPIRLGSWSRRYESDWDFITATLEDFYPEGPVWRAETLALIRPHERVDASTVGVGV